MSFIHDLTKGQRVLFAAAGLCLLAAAYFAFFSVGYLMSALVCLGLAACLIFFGVLAAYKTALARRLRIVMIVLICIGLILFLIAEVPVLTHARSDADTSAPYLIVCGAGIHGTGPSLSMLDRLRQAMTWLEENPAGVAILSGSQGPDELLSEAQVMFTWLTEQGVDENRLILETEADNSYQNLRNALALIAQRGGDPAGRVAILSSEYHLCRLGAMARRLGCQPVLVAAPTSKVSLFINYAIREAVGMWRLWLLGY